MTGKSGRQVVRKTQSMRTLSSCNSSFLLGVSFGKVTPSSKALWSIHWCTATRRSFRFSIFPPVWSILLAQSKSSRIGCPAFNAVTNAGDNSAAACMGNVESHQTKPIDNGWACLFKNISRLSMIINSAENHSLRPKSHGMRFAVISNPLRVGSHYLSWR